MPKPERDILGRFLPKHSLSKHPLHRKWSMIINRCENQNSENYENYGKRGIKICAQWRNDFECFFWWAISNGWKKGLQIDRINNEIGYTPDNCRFVTLKENMRNRRTARIITIGNESFPISKWAELMGIHRTVILHRLKSGWDQISAVQTPLRKQKRKKPL